MTVRTSRAVDESVSEQRRPAPGRCHRALPAFTVALAAIVLSACGTAPPKRIVRLTPEARNEALRLRGVDVEGHPDPLETTEEMGEIARRVAGDGDPVDRLDRLQGYLFDDERFPFEYSRATLTAAEAFRLRKGNCVSFTNLFIALGRSVGLPVLAAGVRVDGDTQQEDDLVIVSTHVVAVLRDSRGMRIYDFNRGRRGSPIHVQLMDDLWINAIYLNNRGVEALRSGRLEAARGYVEDALRLAPAFVGAWGNLGVIRRRAGDIDGAFGAYLVALRLEPRNGSVRRNIARLYGMLALGGRPPARLDGVDPGHDTDTLLRRGDAAMSEGRIDSALSSYRRARRLDPERAEPLIAIARVKLYLGRVSAARRILARALSIDPEHRQSWELLEWIRRTGSL